MTSYDEVVGWSATIREVVDQQRMPPWFANPDYGHFANDARLTDEEKRLIAEWVDNGSPEGNPSDLPKPRSYAEGWRIPQPDQVVYMSDKPYNVPAEGTVAYQYFTADPGFKEDKWIQAVEARPGNRGVVHHIIVFAVPPGSRDSGAFGDGRSGFAGYAPGEQPRIYAPGTALRVPAGSKLLFQLHYTPNGTATTDLSCVGFKFADPKTVKRPARGGAAINAAFVIPPGAGNHEVTSRYTFMRDQMITYLFPHMHLRGKAFRFEVKYPDGRSEILLDVPKYDFNWQLRYDLAEPKLMPKGTVLTCTAHFDNSEENLANPDPRTPVRWGPQTWEEMMIGFFGTIPTQDQDITKLTRPSRKPKA
jgi:hypothetical protein